MSKSLTRKRGRPVDPELHARRRQQILDVAIRLFGEQGYAATDTQQLAETLGVGKGTIYRYFGSKRELFYAALRHVMSELDTEIQAAISNVTNPFEISFRAASAYLRFFQNKPQAVQLLLQELAHFHQDGLPVYFQYRRDSIDRWIEHFNRLIAAKAVRPLPAEAVVEVLGDALFGTMLANFLNRRQPAPEKQVKHIFDVVFTGLLTDSGRFMFRATSILGD